jgi:hypothetical protein
LWEGSLIKATLLPLVRANSGAAALLTPLLFVKRETGMEHVYSPKHIG